jgi:hypothetical protein
MYYQKRDFVGQAFSLRRILNPPGPLSGMQLVAALPPCRAGFQPAADFQSA